MGIAIRKESDQVQIVCISQGSIIRGEAKEGQENPVHSLGDIGLQKPPAK